MLNVFLALFRVLLRAKRFHREQNEQFYSSTKPPAVKMYTEALGYINTAFTAMFFVESILKILAFGLKVGSVD